MGFLNDFKDATVNAAKDIGKTGSNIIHTATELASSPVKLAKDQAKRFNQHFGDLVNSVADLDIKGVIELTTPIDEILDATGTSLDDVEAIAKKASGPVGVIATDRLALIKNLADIIKSTLANIFGSSMPELNNEPKIKNIIELIFGSPTVNVLETLSTESEATLILSLNLAGTSTIGIFVDKDKNWGYFGSKPSLKIKSYKGFTEPSISASMMVIFEERDNVFNTNGSSDHKYVEAGLQQGKVGITMLVNEKGHYLGYKCSITLYSFNRKKDPKPNKVKKTHSFDPKAANLNNVKALIDKNLDHSKQMIQGTKDLPKDSKSLIKNQNELRTAELIEKRSRINMPLTLPFDYHSYNGSKPSFRVLGNWAVFKGNIVRGKIQKTTIIRWKKNSMPKQSIHRPVFYRDKQELVKSSLISVLPTGATTRDNFHSNNSTKMYLSLDGMIASLGGTRTSITISNPNLKGSSLSYQKNSNMIMLSGYIINGIDKEDLLTLPADLHPDQDITVVVPISQNKSYVLSTITITKEGIIKMHAKRAGRILIENITYPLSGSNTSNFLLDGEMVCLTGKITNIDNIIGKTSLMTLPEHAWPEHAMEFIAATNIPETVTKVYISSIGEVTLKPLKGNTNVSEVYLDSIRFARRNQDLLPFEWINYSGNFGEAQLYNNNNIIAANGLICKPGVLDWITGDGEHIARFPQSAKPEKRLVFGASSAGNHKIRVDVDANANVIFVGGDASGSKPWINLERIIYPLSGLKNTIPMCHSWNEYGGIYEGPFYSEFGNMVVLGGLVKVAHSDAKETIGKLPESYRPDKQLIFSQPYFYYGKEKSFYKHYKS